MFCTLSHILKTENEHFSHHNTVFLTRSLTLAHRSLSRVCSWPSLTRWLVFSSPLSTGQWCRALREWYTPWNSTCCLGVQKWGIRSWRGKKYLAVNSGDGSRERRDTWEWRENMYQQGQDRKEEPIRCRTQCGIKKNITKRWLFQSNSHQDKNQVVGKGRDGYHHQRNGLDQVSAKLQDKCKVNKATRR